VIDALVHQHGFSPVVAEALRSVEIVDDAASSPRTEPHRGIVRLVRDTDYMEVAPTDVVTQTSSISFDAATWEIWTALINGAHLYASAIGARPGDVWVDRLPLSRTSVVTLGALQTGGVHTLVQDESAEQGTIMVTDPATLAEMLDAGRDLTAFTIVSLSEQPDPELIERARGVRLGIGYGRPEASVIAHTAAGETAARPLPRVGVRIVDPATRATLAVGEVGEIVTRGVCVMRAYYRDHETKAFDAQGWLRTGDLGSMDECGYLRMTAPQRQISSTGERAAAYGARI